MSPRITNLTLVWSFKISWEALINSSTPLSLSNLVANKKVRLELFGSWVNFIFVKSMPEPDIIIDFDSWKFVYDFINL